MTKALVIGGGVGGLAAGVALRQAGFDVEVYERAPELLEVGAGLSLWANALTALEHLGLKEAVLRHSIPDGASGGVRTWRGKTISLGDAPNLRERFGVTVIGVHRAALQALLLRSLGEEHVHLAKALTRIEEGGGYVTALFADGNSARGDLLVGADGLRSAVRAQLHGEHSPRYAGYGAWRAVVPYHLSADQGGELWGRGQRFGLIPLTEGYTYWFAVRTQAAAVNLSKADLRRLFRDWARPVEALIDAAAEDAIFYNDVYDRPVLPRWGRGRATLLGDAAHPMTPNLGQGACQALEDAVVLGKCLEHERDIATALQQYEAIRRPRTDMVVRQSRLLGAVAQVSNPLLARFRDVFFREVLSKTQERQLQRLLTFEI